MSRSTINRAGKWVLAVGIFLLLLGLVLTMTAGTVLVPICVTSSIFVNALGITMMRHGREGGKRRGGK